MVVALKSSIRAVTVYSRGARVTRVTELGPFDGDEPRRVRIGGLPLAADDRSLHVRIVPSEPGRPAPVAVDVKMTLDVPSLSDELAPAELEELRDVRRKESRLHDQVSRVQRELSRLDRLGLVARPKPLDGSPPSTSPFEGRLQLVELRGQQAELRMAELRELKRELMDLQTARRELEDREARRTTARKAREHELRKTALIELDCSAGNGAGELFIDYLVPGARWAPSYSVSVEPAKGTAELSMRAVVAQNSGEDWGDVALRLSTADAQKFSSLPELTSVRIGPKQTHTPQIGWRPPPTDTDTLFDAYDGAFGGGVAPEPVLGAFDVSAQRDEDDFVEEHLDTTRYMEAVTKEHDVREFEQLLEEEDELTESEQTAIVASKVASRRSRKKKADLRATRRTTAPAPAPAAANEMPMASAAPVAMSARSEAFGTIGSAALEGGEERAISASVELLDYGSLHMPGAGESGRGHLKRVQVVERYMELLREHRVEVDFDVVQTVSEATYVARNVEFRDPPAGCSFAWSDRFDYAYEAGAAASIPSDGRFHSVPVLRAQSSARVCHVCAPRAAAEVFRVATLSNPFPAPLLPGPADIYLDSEFVATSEISMTPRGADIELGLGVDQNVKVARNTRYGEDSAGLLGGTRSLRHEILIEIENLLAREIDLEVRERVPVVAEGEEDIKVEVGKVSPPWSRYEPFPDAASEQPLQGAYRWILRVDAGDKRDLRAHYEVRISSKNELVGGNRRE